MLAKFDQRGSLKEAAGMGDYPRKLIPKNLILNLIFIFFSSALTMCPDE
jgi:hypothetical protein